MEAWPGNSDLNPIENVWSVVKRKMAGKKLASMESLTEGIKSVWVSEISASYCEISHPCRGESTSVSEIGDVRQNTDYVNSFQ